MGKIGKGTKVWHEKGLWGDHEIGDGVKGLGFPTFSAFCSSTLSVRNPLLAQYPVTVTVQSPEVEPIHVAEMRGSSRHQHVLSN